MAEIHNEPLNFDKVWAMFQETDKKFQETDRKIQETNQQLGSIGIHLGEFTESMVRPGVVNKFNSLGFNFDDMYQNRKIRDPKTGRYLAEVDIALENHDFVIVIEVKFKLRNKDIDEHIERMEVLRSIADSKNDNRKYLGAIAGSIVTDETRNYALKAGFYVLEQSDDIMKLDIPEGFLPREW